MELLIRSINVHYSSSLPSDFEATEPGSESSRYWISFDVTPEGNSHILIGEDKVFCDPSYGWLYKDRDQLRCTLHLTPREGESWTAPGVREVGGLRYQDDFCLRYSSSEYRSAELFANYSLSRSVFGELKRDISSGFHPGSIMLDLETDQDMLTYGWEPDGSGLQWNVAKGKCISIGSLSITTKRSLRPIDEHEPDEMETGTPEYAIGKIVNLASAIDGRLENIAGISRSTRGLLAVTALGLLAWALLGR